MINAAKVRKINDLRKYFANKNALLCIFLFKTAIVTI